MNIIESLTSDQIRTDLPAFNIGDTVKVMETRPLSKDKRWRLVEIVERVK